MAVPERRLGAVGTLVWDVNHHPTLVASGAGPLEQWGGATYSLAALSAARPEGWVVEPILKIGSDRAVPARELLCGIPGVRAGAGVQVVPEPNNRVELRYQDEHHRCEVQSGGVPSWRWPELAPLLDGLDALYVNFLSGRELDLNTAERVRAAFGGPIHGDLHSLFLGPATDRPRHPRPLPHWERWVACFDVVQLNETELALLAGARVDDPRFLAELLSFGPSIVVATLGERGALYAAREGVDEGGQPRRLVRAGGGVRSGQVEPGGGALAGDPTGCGDVWGGALFARLLAGRPLETAMREASRLAAEKIRSPSTAALAARLSTALAGGSGGVLP